MSTARDQRPVLGRRAGGAGYAERFATDRRTLTTTCSPRLGGYSPAEITDLTLVLGKYLGLGPRVLDLDQACTIAYDADGNLVTTER